MLTEQLSKLQNLVNDCPALPFTKTELSKQQSQCIHFAHLYRYIAEGTLPFNRQEARNVMIQSESYIIIDSVLFKFSINDSDCKLLIALPQALVTQILHIYHDSLLACHQGVVRVAATIKQHFYFPRLHQQVNDYVKTCVTCQNRKSPPHGDRTYALNIPTSYAPFSRVYADLKTMPPSSEDHRYIDRKSDV